MSQRWTIADLATGAVLCPVFTTPSTGSHPKDNGWAWDAARQKATKIAAVPDTTVQAWSGTAWIDDAVKVEGQLLADVKAEAETRKMVLLSPGGAKKAEYAQKAAEVAFFDSLGGTASLILAALNLMTAAGKAAKFGYAVADAAAFGDTIPAAIERFRAGMSRSVKVPTIAAAEAKACAAIKAAATPAAKRTVAAAVAWPA